MGKINNTLLYGITEAITGSTVIGSLPDGDTVQFDLLGTIAAIVGGVDFVNFKLATKVGQHVVGNVPENSDTDAPAINNGSKFFGTIKVFPPTETDHINYIAKFL